ncbi:HAMP domain-containing histidine kinase [Faecalicatena sp. AGMB00832]|uniref:histidine kinase n=1 Tax=Faecalicatena faecalis TaxID=2726362 RepID=A0ABS6CYW1_9FIRM|nr:HAMP domain-containing sensor histidine kinase [Faecalicatena faecalis]MBU3874441.1 HAMP domain-containing histidine kinase [Faecalicatena faecalis]
MIRTLQKKFITTAMLAISILLLVLLGAINVGYYLVSGQQEKVLLDMLAKNEGMPPHDMGPQGKEKGTLFGPPMNEDTAMSARFFTVYMDSDGKIVRTDVSRISSVTEDEAREYAKDAASEKKDSGRMNGFRYRISQTRDGQGTVFLFLDTSIQRRNFLLVLALSIFIGIICWGLMLLLVILLSKKAILPIAANMEKQKQFVTNAGHEIKTPLAIIMANTDAMELHQGESKWSRNIRNQTIRLNGLMQNLLTLSRMDEEVLRLHASEFSMSQLTEEMLHPFYESAALKQIEIRKEIQQDVMIRANKEHFTQLVSVLLDNAVKYTNEGGEIDVCLEKAEKRVVLRVKNTCEKLPEGEPEKLFDRFYRGDSARTQKSGGYGIGLSVAQAIVEAHKGTITAEYEDGNRIAFTVRI